MAHRAEDYRQNEAWKWANATFGLNALHLQMTQDGKPVYQFVFEQNTLLMKDGKSKPVWSCLLLDRSFAHTKTLGHCWMGMYGGVMDIEVVDVSETVVQLAA